MGDDRVGLFVDQDATPWLFPMVQINDCDSELALVSQEIGKGSSVARQCRGISLVGAEQRIHLASREEFLRFCPPTQGCKCQAEKNPEAEVQTQRHR